MLLWADFRHVFGVFFVFFKLLSSKTNSSLAQFVLKNDLVQITADPAILYAIVEIQSRKKPKIEFVEFVVDLKS